MSPELPGIKGYRNALESLVKGARTAAGWNVVGVNGGSPAAEQIGPAKQKISEIQDLLSRLLRRAP